MKNIEAKCKYTCGPYKDYFGQAEYDQQSGTFHGDVLGTRDVITFQGNDIPSLQQAFIDSIDDYLAFCKESGVAAEKPASGKFVARISPKLHSGLTTLAKRAGKSLNQFVSDALQEIADAHGLSTSSAPMPTKTLNDAKRAKKKYVAIAKPAHKLRSRK